MAQFAIYCQDYKLVLNENGSGDVKQKATGAVLHFAALFPTKAAARKHLRSVILPDARSEGYRSEYWIGPFPHRNIPMAIESQRW